MFKTSEHLSITAVEEFAEITGTPIKTDRQVKIARWKLWVSIFGPFVPELPDQTTFHVTYSIGDKHCKNIINAKYELEAVGLTMAGIDHPDKEDFVYLVERIHHRMSTHVINAVYIQPSDLSFTQMVIHSVAMDEMLNAQ